MDAMIRSLPCETRAHPVEWGMRSAADWPVAGSLHRQLRIAVLVAGSPSGPCKLLFAGLHPPWARLNPPAPEAKPPL